MILSDEEVEEEEEEEEEEELLDDGDVDTVMSNNCFSIDCE